MNKTLNRFILTAAIAALLFWVMPAIFSVPAATPVARADSHILFSTDFSGFAGAGFNSPPAAGQLDSNLWRVLGMSDGNSTFAGSHTSGDFARGSSTGGVTTGGVYAFDVGGGNVILGVQPGGSDFTPGSFDLRLQNSTGDTIESLTVSYKIWVYNDQGRANSLNFAYSLDDSDYTAVPALDYTTPEAADGSPVWVSVDRETTLTGLSLAAGDYIYLRWQSNDVSGGGSRDEFGIDDIVVTIPDPPAVTLTKTGPALTFAGDEIVYELTITNMTDSPLTSVVLTDTLPAATTYISDDSGLTPTSPNINTYVWALGSLAASASTTIQVTAATDDTLTANTDITNVATVNSAETDPVTAEAATTIYPIRPVSAARAGSNGDVFALEGRVTVTNGTWSFNEWAFQDDTAGIAAFFNTVPSVSLGDTVRLIATRGSFNNQAQMVSPIIYFEVIESGTPVVPTVYDTGQVATGATEGWLVELEGIVSNYDGSCGDSHNFDLDDGSGRADIRIDWRSDIDFCQLGIANGDRLNVVGFSTRFQSTFQVKPRFVEDITTFKPGIVKDVDFAVAPGQLLTYTITINNQLGYTLDNLVISSTLPAANAAFAYALDDGTEDAGTVLWSVGNLGNDDSLSVRFAVTATGPAGSIITSDLYAVRASNFVTPTFGQPAHTFIGDYMPIHQIQGEDFLSPYQGFMLPTQGVVTGFFEGNLPGFGSFNTFFIQDPDGGGSGTSASDGLMINVGTTPPAISVGDLVRVTGEVQEFSEWDGANCALFGSECVTQLAVADPAADITVLSSGHTIVPTVVTPPLGDVAAADLYWESLEGVLVTLPVTGVVVGPTSFNTIDVIRGDYGLSRILRNTLYEGTAFGVRHYLRNGNMPDGVPSLIAGSVITNVTGPLGYSYGRYIAFTQAGQEWEAVSSAPPPAIEPTWPEATEDEFTVMSFNIENFSDPSGSQMDKVLQNLDNLNGPTFIGIQEIRVSTVMTDLLNALAGLGYPYDYAYSHPDMGGHGVAVLWRTDRVTDVEWSTDFQGCSPVGTTSSTYDPLWEECRAQNEYPLFSRRPVVVTGTVQFDAGEMRLVVIGNHFKSKLGGIPADMRRLGQAELVADLADTFAATTTPYVIVLGDLNDFEDSPPLAALYASGTLTNTWFSVAPEERYSYVFRGTAQILDHILVSEPLLTTMKDVGGIHNSAEFPFAPYRTDGSVVWRVSDHDQKMATFGLVATNHTILLDGVMNEWGSGILGTANDTTFATTWDASFLYFGAQGGLAPSDSLLIGIDLDPTDHVDNDGGSAAFCGAAFPDENRPDYILRVRQGGDGYLREGFAWNGSDWVSMGGVFSSDGFGAAAWQDADRFDFAGGTDYEVKIEKALLGIASPDDAIGVYLWLADGFCEFFNAWPPENPNGWTDGVPTRFLYAHTLLATTDDGRFPSSYGSRVAWATHTLADNNTAYDYFGEDDSDAGNPWLRLSTTNEGGGGAACEVRAKLVANNAFAPDDFVGINRFVDFNLTGCDGLEVNVQMRYEVGELNGVDETGTRFYRCPAGPCSDSWAEVVSNGGSYTRSIENNYLLLTNVPQTQFSYWTISDNQAPTNLSLAVISVSTVVPWPLLLLLLLVLGSSLVMMKMVGRRMA